MTGILQDKVAVITGGSRGLGLGIAQAYAREGAKIVIGSRSQRSVDTAVEMLKGLFTVGLRQLLHLPVDLMKLNVITVEPVLELVPVHSEDD